MENSPEVLRYAAFSTTPDGGNPAGLVLDARHLDDAGMLAVAAAVGYAETAFVTEQGVQGDPRRSRVRYFSPIAEVPFCGHATTALAVALRARDGAGSFTFDTPVGPVLIETAGEGADITASFTAVEPRLAEFDDAVLAKLLGLLGVGLGDLDPAYRRGSRIRETGIRCWSSPRLLFSIPLPSIRRRCAASWTFRAGPQR